MSGQLRLRLRLLLVGTLVACLTLLVAAAPAAAQPDSSVLVVAAEGGGEEAEPIGPEPMPADATDNPAAPTDYEANFLWGAAVGLLALTVFALLAVGGLYYLLVARPRQHEDTKA